MEWLGPAVLSLTTISAGLFLWNLLLFRRAPQTSGSSCPGISLLIPARNEESAIGAAVEAALASTGVDLEVIVLDDASDDATATIVRGIAARDSRLRLETAPHLPSGWCGKQHACHVLSQLASHQLLCFLDADVRLQPDALARMARLLQNSEADLVSGFPRQETGTFLERLLVPQIHFVLLCYLPLIFLRLTRHPAFAAGCGQLMLVRREAYVRAGGHAAIRSTLHDGLRLPAAFRNAGLRTDLFDAADAATCRMFRTSGEAWRGLGRNAVEGMAAPLRLPVFTLLLFGGHVLPFVLVFTGSLYAVAACALAWGIRLAAAFRFRQPADSALLHPVGVMALLILQWTALVRHLRRVPASWKGRAYAARTSGL